MRLPPVIHPCDRLIINGYAGISSRDIPGGPEREVGMESELAGRNDSSFTYPFALRAPDGSEIRPCHVLIPAMGWKPGFRDSRARWRIYSFRKPSYGLSVWSQ
jgi:hypothetical protein